jgi:hypothetical protein
MVAAAKASDEESFDPAIAGAELLKVTKRVAELVDLPLGDENTKQAYVDFARPCLQKLCSERLVLNELTKYRQQACTCFEFS